MSRSIIQDKKSGRCFLCGARGVPLEEHHVFGGGCRRLSEHFGLKVYLCHSCHNEPPNGAHFNKETMLYLHQYGQKKAMAENGWTIDDFRREFYKNYL